MTQLMSVSVLLAFIPVLSAAQNIREREAAQAALAGRALLVERRDLSIREAFHQLLRSANLPGGLELIHCYGPVPRVIINPEASVEHGLSQIASIQPDLSMSISRQGVVDLMSSAHPALLDVIVSDLEIADARVPWMTIVRKILATPEVRAKIAELGFKEARVELGIWAMPKPGASLPERKLALHGVTVRQALNAVAKISGSGVWVYEESGCSSNREFSISFPVY